jgi:hypothetical protein
MVVAVSPGTVRAEALWYFYDGDEGDENNEINNINFTS